LVDLLKEMRREKKVGVMLLCPFYPPNLGGVETHLQLLTDYLVKGKYEVFVLTYKPLITRVKYKPYEERKNLKIWRFWWFGQFWFDKLTPFPPFQFFYIVPGLFVYTLVWMIKNHKKVEVIHAHGFAAAWMARLVGFIFPGKKKVVSTHFIYKKIKLGQFYGLGFKWVMQGFDRILTVSQESCRELTALGLDPGKMDLFYHWLDLNEFKPKSKKHFQKKLKIPSQAKLTVLFAGRLLKMKGIFRLLEVAKDLPKEIVFIILGSGPDEQLLRAKSSGVKNFIMVGRKPHRQVADYLAACDFLILPSTEKEAQPAVVMEALACGRPVVATNKGSVKEMFNTQVGVVIEPSKLKIKEAILDFYNHPQKLKSMSVKARRFAKAKFNSENAKIITTHYQ